MDMNTGGDALSSGPLNASGVDFTNETQAFDFLQEILNNSFLQIDGNRSARYFWYGIVVFVGIAAICNTVWTVVLHTR